MRNALSERKSEFSVHFELARVLDQGLIKGDSLLVDDLLLSVSHILTIKSGLVIHLYNIVESTMSGAIDEVGKAVRDTPPSDWSEDALREWLRNYSLPSTEGGEESRLKISHGAALKLLRKAPIDELKFKKPPGTWSDTVIHKFSKRLGIEFRLSQEMARKLSSGRYGDLSPLSFLAVRRNAIAHGTRPFEKGAQDLTMADIEELASITFDYMAAAVDAFQNYVDGQLYRTQSAS